MVAPPRNFTSGSNVVPFVTGEHGGISRARWRHLAATVGCLLATSTVACGGTSGTQYETRADLDPLPSTLDAGLSGSDASVDSRETSGADGASRPPAPFDSSAGAPTPATTATATTATATTATAITTTAPHATSTDAGDSRAPDETSGPIPVPVDGPGARTNCTELRQEADGECRYTLECDNFSATSTCQANADGTWACDCAGPVMSSEQTMPATDVSQVCETSAAFCIQTVPGGVSTFECEDTTSSLASERCVAKADCRRTTTFDDGTIVRTPVPLEVQCVPNGDSSLHCTCSDYSGWREYAVDGAGLDDGCAVMTASCGLTPSETITCGTRDYDDVACDAECGHEVATGAPGARVRLLDTHVSSHCEIPTPGGDWYCSCATEAPYGGLFPVVPSAATAEVACSSAVNTCLEPDAFEPVGAPDCSVAHFYETASSCSAGADCQQPGVSGEHSVALRGLTLGASCELTDAGLWRCYCAGQTASELFDMDASTSAQACTDAYDKCQAAARYVPMHDGSPSFVFIFDGQDAGAE